MINKRDRACKIPKLSVVAVNENLRRKWRKS